MATLWWIPLSAHAAPLSLIARAPNNWLAPTRPLLYLSIPLLAFLTTPTDVADRASFQPTARYNKLVEAESKSIAREVVYTPGRDLRGMGSLT